jgi:hypothetical protein
MHRKGHVFTGKPRTSGHEEHKDGHNNVPDNNDFSYGMIESLKEQLQDEDY